MDFADSPEEGRFRVMVRAWLGANAPAFAPPEDGWTEEALVAQGRAWLACKASERLSAIQWPVDLGGRDGSPIEAMIFAEEEARFTLPIAPFANIGINMAIPAIRRHGSPAQLERFATKTLKGELLWCQLFSEPSAGSDLAAVRTRAVREGDLWRINGQKVWSSWAHHADWGILLARSDPSLPKHKGLTFFLVDMKSPGIDIRAIRQLNEKAEFNETFMTDLVVPDDCRVGAEGEGWAVAMTVLTGERMSSTEEAGGIAALIELARHTPGGGGMAIDHGDTRARLAGWYANEQAERFFRYRLMTRLSRGQSVGAEAAVVKLAFATRLQQSSAFALELAGFAGAIADSGDGALDRALEDYLWAPAMRIAGGADEVLRNQIAERVLGLPGELRADKDVPLTSWTRAEMPGGHEREAAITGVGLSSIGRRLDRSGISLTIEAALAAIADAGLPVGEIDGIAGWPGYVKDIPGMSPTAIWELKEALGLRLAWYAGIAEGPAQLSSVVEAAMAVASGRARHVLCFRTLTESSSQTAERRASSVAGVGERVGDRYQWQVPFKAYSAANWTALYAQARFHEFGMTREQLGAVALNARRNAADNPLAIYREPLTMDDYLSSRMISTPLCLYDCDIPIDGSAAVIVSSIEAARDLRHPPLRIEAAGTALSGRDSWDQRADLTSMAAMDAGPAMWARTDLTPADVDVAQVYDGFSIYVPMWLEALGFFANGAKVARSLRGARIARDGALPLNTAGGQLSAGRLHGFGLLHEACFQLWGRGEARQVAGSPEVAVVGVGGGPLASCVVLTRQ